MSMGLLFYFITALVSLLQKHLRYKFGCCFCQYYYRYLESVVSRQDSSQVNGHIKNNQTIQASYKFSWLRIETAENIAT